MVNGCRRCRRCGKVYSQIEDEFSIFRCPKCGSNLSDPVELDSMKLRRVTVSVRIDDPLTLKKEMDDRVMTYTVPEGVWTQDYILGTIRGALEQSIAGSLKAVLPCPFCGKMPEVRNLNVRGDPYGGTTCFGCPRCDVWMTGSDALIRWNRRVLD